MSTQLLPGPKERFLLEADVAVLHHESLDWLNDIAFWRDEAAFFHHLLRKTGSSDTREDPRTLLNVEKELVRISSGELTELQQDIISHERFLDAAMSGKALDNERIFRGRHWEILQRLAGFNFRFRELKRYIFRFIGSVHRTPH